MTEEKNMTSTWTDERLDRFADKVDQQGDRINALIEQIGQLVQALYLEVPNLKAEINGVSEEARESRETISQSFQESNDRMARIEDSIVKSNERMARIETIISYQSAIADKQAESVRQLIEMLNRKLA